MARRKDTRSPRAGRRRLGRGLDSLISTPVEIAIPEEPQEPPVSEEDAPSAPTPDAPGRKPPRSGQDQPPPATTAPPPGQAAGPAARPATPPEPPPESPPEPPAATPPETPAPGLTMLDPAQVQPNPHQPRQRFDEASLDALAQSIRKAGLMQPIVVRPDPDDTAGRYQLIAGERRWRAASRIGLAEIPAVVRDVDEQTAAQWSLIENLQREDLDPIERARAFQRLVEEFALTHQLIARQVGLDRTTVTNHLRLLELDELTRRALQDGRLTMGHAKLLLAIANNTDRQALAARAVRQAWSVRELDRAIRQRARQGAGTPPPAAAAPAPLSATRAHLADLEQQLGTHLGTRVHIRPGKKKGSGKLTIEFYSLDHFDGLMQKLDFHPDPRK